MVFTIYYMVLEKKTIIWNSLIDSLILVYGCAEDSVTKFTSLKRTRD